MANWFERTPSAAPGPTPEQKEARAKHRIGFPRILNIWTTHQFWLGFFEALGIPNNRVVFSSDRAPVALVEMDAQTGGKTDGGAKVLRNVRLKKGETHSKRTRTEGMRKFDSGG